MRDRESGDFEGSHFDSGGWRLVHKIPPPRQGQRGEPAPQQPAGPPREIHRHGIGQEVFEREGMNVVAVEMGDEDSRQRRNARAKALQAPSDEREGKAAIDEQR